MRAFLLLILLLIPYTAPGVLVSATFTTSTTAIVSWQQPAGVPISCLRIYHAGAEWPAGICWRDLEAGPMRVVLPGIYAHPAYRPELGDRLVLAFGLEDVGSAFLGEAFVYRTYLPAVAKSALPNWRVYLPVFRG